VCGKGLNKLRYFIGVDGGGTKTAVCVASEDSSVFFSATTGSASWREHGIKTVICNIKEVINGFSIGDNGSIAGITLGIPCFGESNTGDRKLEKAISTEFHGIPVHITNDVEVGWAGSLGLSPGISVVSGTGSIAFGKDESGNTARCGGWSEYFSDEGSCYWIGRKVMELFSKQSDGRTARDALYNMVREELDLKSDVDFIDLMHKKYIKNREKVASLQLLAQKAALAGSPGARALYDKAAGELCLLVTTIEKNLDFKQHPFTVSYSGGLFKTGDLIMSRFLKEIEAAGGKLSTPKFEPVHGALLLAFERFHPEGLTLLFERLETI